MTFVPYKPEPPQYESIWSAYQAITAPHIGARIEADPKGPVNKIVSLVTGDHFTNQRRVKSALVPWTTLSGATVTLERTSSQLSRWEFFALQDNRPFEIGESGYRILVDGREVLYASDAEIWPAPKQVPQRGLNAARNVIPAAKARLLARVRSAADAIARRAGYVRESEVSDW